MRNQTYNEVYIEIGTFYFVIIYFGFVTSSIQFFAQVYIAFYAFFILIHFLLLLYSHKKNFGIEILFAFGLFLDFFYMLI